MARVLGRYAIVVVLLAVAYGVVPVARPGLIGALGLASVTAIELGVRRLRPERAGAWRCLQGSLALLGLGDMLFLLIDSRSPLPVPYPAVPDVITLLGYLLLSVALFWLGRPRAPQREETSLIDAISLTLAGSLVVWVALVRPVVDSQAPSQPGQLTAVVAMVVYIAVFASAIRVVLAWRRNAAVILLGLALVWFLASELIYGYQLVYGSQLVRGALAPYAGGIDLGYVALAAGCGAAALTPSMRDIAAPPSGRHSLTPWRLALIAVGLLVAPAVLVIETTRGHTVTGLSIALVGSLVSGLVLVRLSMSGRAYRARAAREQAVRVASQAMVSAVNPADVLAGTRNALHALLRAHGLIEVEQAEKENIDYPLGTVVPVGSAGRGRLALALSRADSVFVFTAPLRVLLELADLLDSLTDQAAVALQRITLTAADGAKERDRYFRTLVLTSTDAILITRDDHIEYATPSAESMFGRDIHGDDFNELVRQPDQRDTRATWPNTIDGAEGVIRRPQGDATVVIHRRDLTADPTVRGFVTTLRDVTAERMLQRDLAYRASHDELTGMANTRSWGETLAAEKDRRRGPGNGIAVIFIDLDDFKKINDDHGHPTGDQVLADMGRRIRDTVRTGDVAARVGGDEFAVLLRRLPNVEDARAVAQRLAETLARPAVVDSTEIEAQASIGLAYTEGQERIDALVRQADTALYAAKEQGKGRWTEYNGTQWVPPRTTRDGGRHGR